MRRKVPNVMRSSSKISFGELNREKASSLMSHYGLSERQLQQQLAHHIGDASQAEQKSVYNEVYANDKKQ